MTLQMQAISETRATGRNPLVGRVATSCSRNPIKGIGCKRFRAETARRKYLLTVNCSGMNYLQRYV
jgi:hypothetical protein